MTEFTHIDEAGRVRMVDVSDKPITDRTAAAEGRVRMNPETFDRIIAGRVKKGNVLETARIAGIMAAKRTDSLIPMCHPVPLSFISIDFDPEAESTSFLITAIARTADRTGVEMEALTAVSTAALTLYDMCKSHDRSMVISGIRLMEKTGGKSGVYRREIETADTSGK